MINQENTYLGADGLAYCKICGEPVEAFFPPDSILGMKKHFRQCACIRQKREVEEKAYKEREHRELVERNRKICFEEPRMYDWNFELAEKTTTIEKAKEYTANWNDMKKNHIGFLLWGPIGTGKSYIAGCIANALLNREITVKMTNFNTIIDDMFPLEDKTEYINALARYELLILDDLGTERNSEYALGIASLGKDSGYVPYTAFSAKKSYLKENPDVIQRFTNALQKGMDYVRSHSPSETASVIKPQFPETTLEMITTIVTRYYEQDTWKSNLIFEESSFDLLQDILESAGELEKRAPYKDLITTEFAENAAK